jgi:NTP pyrophosphatase (non-canonical NTP hydrolase)
MNKMEIKEAQQKVEEVIKHYGEYWEPLSQLARLTEEVGELSRAMNIKFGGKESKGDDDGRDMASELADVFTQVLAIANANDIDLEREFEEKIAFDFEKMRGVYVK